MAVKQRHKIQKMVFDLSTTGKESASNVQDQLSRLNQSKLPRILSDLIDQFTPESETIRIQRLELDLGRLRLDHLEKDLIEAIKNQLTKAMKSIDQPVKGAKVNGLKKLSIQERDMEVLSHFLKTGTKTWHQETEGRSIDAIFADLVKHPNRYPKGQLMKLLEHSRIRKRLVHRFGAKHFEGFLRVLNPTAAKKIQRVYAFFRKGQQQEKWYRASDFVFRELLQMELLTQLVSRSSTPNITNLTTDLGAALAKRFPVRVEPPLEEIARTGQTANMVRPGFSKRFQAAELGLHFLEYGTIPYWARVNQFADLNHLLLSLPADHIRSMKTMSRNRRDRMIRRWIGRLAFESREKLVEQFFPKQQKWMLAFRSQFLQHLTGKPRHQMVDAFDEGFLQFYFQRFNGRLIKSTFVSFLGEQLRQAGEYQGLRPLEEAARAMGLPPDKKSEQTLPISKTPSKESRLSKSEKPSAPAQLDYILFFLEEGYRPWWGVTFEETAINTLIQDLIQQKPNALADALADLFDSSNVQDRFLVQIDTATRNSFWAIIQPKAPQFLTTWVHDFEEQLPGSIRARMPNLEKLAWELCFFDRSVNRKVGNSTFLLRFIRVLAQQLNIAETGLLCLAQQLPAIESNDSTGALTIEKIGHRIATRYFEEAEQLNQAGRSVPNDPQKTRQFDQLENALRDLMNRPNIQTETIQFQLVYLLKEMQALDPRKRRTVLLECLAHPTVQQQIQSTQHSELLAITIDSIQPRALPEIKRLMADLEKLFLVFESLSTIAFREMMQEALIQYLTFKPGFSFDPLRLVELLARNYAQSSGTPFQKVVEQLAQSFRQRKAAMASQLSITLDRFIQEVYQPSVNRPTRNVLEHLHKEEKTNGMIQSAGVQWYRTQQERIEQAGPFQQLPKPVPKRLNPPKRKERKPQPEQEHLAEREAKESTSNPYVEFLQMVKKRQEREQEQQLKIMEGMAKKAQQQKRKANNERSERRLAFEEKLFAQQGLGKRKRKKKNPLLTATAENPIYVNNAGMVILWPYLSFYFKNLGLDLEKMEDRKRAVHLLQYVVFLTGEAPEEDLALNKVLCGVPLEEPIPRSIDLTDQEKDLSEQLLRAVCKNWEKMEHTSNMNLRVSFLQREGKLTEQEDGWYLKIDKQVLDLLLEKLSWGIGMIKLSWMDKLMHVEWI